MKSTILFVFCFFLSQFLSSQKFDCKKSIIEKSELEDSLLLKIENPESLIKFLNGKWKFKSTVDENGKTRKVITENFPSANNEILKLENTYFYNHELIFNEYRYTQNSTFVENSNILQQNFFQLIYLPKQNIFKKISLDENSECAEIPSIFKMNSISDEKLVFFYIPHDNDEKVKYLLFEYEKVK